MDRFIASLVIFSAGVVTAMVLVGPLGPTDVPQANALTNPHPRPLHPSAVKPEKPRTTFKTDSVVVRASHSAAQTSAVAGAAEPRLLPSPSFAGGLRRPKAWPGNLRTRDRQARALLQSCAEVYSNKLSVIANNLAQRDTVGYKRDRVVLRSQPGRELLPAGSLDSGGNPAPAGIAIGGGVRIEGIQIIFAPGRLRQTGNSLDVAIRGKGFFQVTEPGTGEIQYTRAGEFSLNVNNQLVMASAHVGRHIDPPIIVPSDTQHVVIKPDGQVCCAIAGSTSLQSVGQIQLAIFPNPGGLLKVGQNCFAETDGSSNPTTGTPGVQGFGVLKQGFLEESNVNEDDELEVFRRTSDFLQRILGLLSN